MKKVTIDFSKGLNMLGLPIVSFYQGEVKLNFLFDTGASDNIISSKVLDKIEHTVLDDTVTVSGIDGIPHKTKYCNIGFEKDNTRYFGSFMIMDNPNFDSKESSLPCAIQGILGNTFFKKTKSVISYKDKKIIVEG